ncbi:hypothetical protein D3C84_1159900 [compost metagenome]
MQAGHHRAALALILRQAQQMGLRVFGQLLQQRGAGRARGVVDQYAGQAGAAQGRNHGGQRVLVVVHRDDGAGAMHGLSLRRMG